MRPGGEPVTTRLIRLVAGVLVVLVVAVPTARPQTTPPVVMPGAPSFPPEQLDRLLAPIALYPDPLLAQILMAATYPVEVVQANRWRQDPRNAGLAGDELAAAVELQPWDPSVKSLVPFPQILQMMDRNLDWTVALGDAFLAQEAAVMDAVQRLRQMAQAAGTLTSTPQQSLVIQEQAIGIMPVDPQVVYVPAYDPGVVYGPWPYAAYPPVLLYPPPVVVGGPVVSFGFGIGVVGPLWGWHRWDWHRHRVAIDGPRFHAIDPHRPPPKSDTWRHDPDHRHGVPYRDAPTRDRFQFGPASTPDARRGYRGYEPAPPAPSPPPARPVPAPPSSGPRAPAPPVPPSSVRPAPAPAPPPRPAPAYGIAPSPAPGVSRPPGVQAPPPAAPARPVAPAFESFGRGADIRVESDRGRASRSSVAPAPAPPAGSRPSYAPRPPAAPSGGPPPGSGSPHR
jgi:hypothetical protein